MPNDERNPVSNRDEQAEAKALLTQLAGSVALLPQEIPEGAEPPPEGAIALPVIEQDGTQFVPVFTSQESLVRAGADAAPARGGGGRARDGGAREPRGNRGGRRPERAKRRPRPVVVALSSVEM